MTNEEIKNALMDERHVQYNGIEFEKVSAIIYRKSNGKVSISAEMLDKNSNSVAIAPVEKVQNCGGVE